MSYRILLGGGLTVNLIGHSVCAPGWSLPDRKLDEMELIVVYSGRLSCDIGENSYILSEGEACLVPPRTLVTQRSRNGSCRFFYAHFTAETEWIEQQCAAQMVSEYVKPHVSEDSYFFQLSEMSREENVVDLPPSMKACRYRDEIFTLFEKALLERNRPSAGYKLMISFYIRQILLYLYRACLQESPVQSQHSSKEQKKVVQDALLYIHSHYDRAINIERLSRKLSVSHQYLARQFKLNVGLSPVKYINRFRVEQAKERMRTTSRNLEEIACDVGFENSFYFSRIFKQYEGISPAKYRSWLNSRSNQ